MFDEVAKKGVPYVLTRDSRPEAVLISYEDVVRFQQGEQIDKVGARITELNAGVSETEAGARRAINLILVDWIVADDADPGDIVG